MSSTEDFNRLLADHKAELSRIEELEAAIQAHKESFEPGDCATEDRELWEVLGQEVEQWSKQ